MGVELKNPHRKDLLLTKCYTGSRTWWGLVNMVMNLPVALKVGNFLTS